MAKRSPKKLQEGLARARERSLKSGMFRSWRERWILASRRTKVAIWLLPLVSGLLLTLLVLVLRNWHGDVEYAPLYEEDLVEDVVVDEPLEIDGSIRLSAAGQAVLQKHFSALGGGQRIGSIVSIQARGILQSETGEGVPAVFISKGDQQRLSLKTSEGQRILAISDSDRWQCRWRAGNLVERADLDVLGLEQLGLSGYALHTLYREVRESGQVAYLGTKPFEYKTRHCFELEAADGSHIRYFIDADSFLDAGREIRRFAPDGTLRVIKQVFGERMDIGGIQVPKQIQGFVNGILVQTFDLVDINLNVGIFDSTFERPTEPLVEAVEIRSETFGGAPDRRLKPMEPLLPGKP